MSLESMISKEDEKTAVEWIESLPERYGIIMTMTIDGHTLQEISDRTGFTVEHTCSLRTELRAKLRSRLEC